jgi:flavin-dependent dehydrogenase
MVVQCDVLVLGQGAAAMAAAWSAAEEGLHVACVDCRAPIGIRKPYVECFSEWALKLLDRRPPKELAKWAVDGAIMWTDTYYIKAHAEAWRAYCFARKDFDAWAAREAARAGARIYAHSTIRRVGGDEVVIYSQGNERIINAEIFIATDGFDPLLFDEVKLTKNIQDSLTEKDFYATSVLVELIAPNMLKSNYIQLFPHIFRPGIMAFISPLSSRHCVAGVAAAGFQGNLDELLHTFMEEIPISAPQFKDAIPLSTYEGGLQLFGPKMPGVVSNKVLVGSPRQNLIPVRGQSIITSMVLGRLAAKKAAEAIKLRTLEKLTSFEDQAKDLFNRLVVRADSIVELLRLEDYAFKTRAPTEKKKLLEALFMSSNVYSPEDINYIITTSSESADIKKLLENAEIVKHGGKLDGLK